ncbi:MAG: hypothetical protein GOMPHAMPRED_007019 [Gomphillus americanus]|uniref:N-acetyltransferase domain-containing protein n=1 Tax=Gomphillus americanus TaxID=1940652 RepID=A0A8H3I0J1_9LECA|nr:MAG: hypothetical protein GOMPHAMPRED_007019 [Gomphillus americanus]
MFYTKRLMLRNLDPRCDTSTWQHWLNTVSTARVFRTEGLRPTSTEDVSATVTKVAKGGDILPCLAICLLPSDEQTHPDKLLPSDDLFVKTDGSARYPMIGCLNLRGSPTPTVNVTNRTASLGIFLMEAYTGKGYGPEVLEWVFWYLFDALGLHRLEILTLASNKPARKAYEKVGFVEEGRARKAIFQDGVWEDVVSLAVLEEDYWARKKKKVDGDDEEIECTYKTF